MASGNVTYFDDEGGYGFIETGDADDDVFFHMADTDEEEDLAEGDSVTFDIEQGDKGPRAANLARADDEDEE